MIIRSENNKTLLNFIPVFIINYIIMKVKRFNVNILGMLNNKDL